MEPSHQPLAPFSPHTLPSSHAVAAGPDGAPRSRERHQECRAIRARGSGPQANGEQLSAFIPATFLQLLQGASRGGSHPQNLSIAPFLRGEPRVWGKETFSELEKRSDNLLPPTGERHHKSHLPRRDSLSFGTGKKGTLTRSRLDSEQPLGSQVARTKTLLSRGPFAGKRRYWEGVARGPLQAKGGSLGNPAASECVLHWKPGRWVSSQSPWVPGDAAWAPVCALQVSCASRNLNRSEKTRCWEWGLFYSLSPPRSLGIGMLV